MPFMPLLWLAFKASTFSGGFLAFFLDIFCQGFLRFSGTFLKSFSASSFSARRGRGAGAERRGREGFPRHTLSKIDFTGGRHEG